MTQCSSSFLLAMAILVVATRTGLPVAAEPAPPAIQPMEQPFYTPTGKGGDDDDDDNKPSFFSPASSPTGKGDGGDDDDDNKPSFFSPASSPTGDDDDDDDDDGKGGKGSKGDDDDDDFIPGKGGSMMSRQRR